MKSKKSVNKKENNLKNISFKEMFFLFIIFSFIGCLYEDILLMVKGYLKTGVLNYVTKRGLLYFELSPIYGWGACLMIYLLTRKPYKKIDYFVWGSLIGGVFEFLISFLQETFTGTVSWNYSSYPLNIDGRTSIPIMCIWGGFCFLLMVYVYPFFLKLIRKIPKEIGKTLYKITLVLITADMFLSFSACIRLGLRHKNYEPLTFYGEFLDRVYDDERMKKSYTNMVDTK